MASQLIALSDDSILCEYVPLDDFKGYLQQRIGIGPDLLAMLIRDGQVATASHGAHIAIGGIWRSVKDAVFGQHSLKLLIADLKPFQLATGFSALTRDKVAVSAFITIELQVNPEQPEGVLGFARDSEIVIKDAMLARIGPHLQDRVLQNVVGQVDALALRGDKAAQDKIQAEVMTEVERVFGDMALLVRAVSVQWAVNEEEIAEMQAQAADREQDRLDRKLANLKREVEREQAVTELKITTELAEEKLKSASDDELRHMILSQELAFLDAEETGKRQHRMAALQGEIDELKTEQTAKFELALAETKNDVELRKVQAQMRVVEREIEDLDRAHERNIRELDRRSALELERAEKLQGIDIGRAAHESQAKTLRDLNDIDLEAEQRRQDMELRGGDAEHRRSLESRRQEDDTEIAKLRLKSQMTPEQILAIDAGMSPEVAAIFAERARSEASGSAERMELMREMISDAKAKGVADAEQARFYATQMKEMAIGVAEGASGAAAEKRTSAPAQPATTACPSCGRPVADGVKFCAACGASISG